MPKLVEPLLTQAIANRFRAFNAVASAAPAGSSPTKVGQLSAQVRTGINPIATTTAIRAASFAPAPAPTPVPTSATGVLALVQPASRSPADLQLQAQVSDELSKYITAISRAIVAAHDNWRQRAFLRGVQISGITAMGGSVSGPSLAEVLGPGGPSQGLWNNAAAYTAAISNGLASAWKEWEQTVRVPGLNWYPTFAAVPGPQAPPIPNIPTPMSQLTWSPVALSADHMTMLISRSLAKPGPYSEQLFASVADGFSKSVAGWLPTQMVVGVLGKGPVPSFAPPYVPVGSVMGGNIVEVGPHFAT